MEIFQIDGFIKLGPSRLIMAFNFITVTIGICIAAFLFSSLSPMISKIGDVIVKRVWTFLAIVCNLVTLVSVVGIFLLGWSYRINNFPNRIEIAVSDVIEENGWIGTAIQRINLPSTVGSHAVQMHLREVGGLAIYWDFYFPFSAGAALEWSRRQKIITKIEECLVQSSISVCDVSLEHERVLFLTEGVRLTPDSVSVGSIRGTDLWLTPSWL